MCRSLGVDGEKIAFTDVAALYGMPTIRVRNADGSPRTSLTTIGEWNQSPRWSPDGRKIAFTSGRDANYEIYVMNADGTAQTRLMNHPADNLQGRWRP